MVLRCAIALLMLTSAFAGSASACHRRAASQVRPGFFGHHRWAVGQRLERGGFVARLRFKPGR